MFWRVLAFCISAPLVANALSVDVRSAEHEGFSRLVFDLSERAAFQMSEADNVISLRLSTDVESLNKNDLFRRLSEGRIEDVELVDGTLNVQLGCACTAETFAYRRSIVVDIAPKTEQAEPVKLPTVFEGSKQAAWPLADEPQSIDLSNFRQTLLGQLARANAQDLIEPSLQATSSVGVADLGGEPVVAPSTATTVVDRFYNTQRRSDISVCQEIEAAVRIPAEDEKFWVALNDVRRDQTQSPTALAALYLGYGLQTEALDALQQASDAELQIYKQITGALSGNKQDSWSNTQGCNSFADIFLLLGSSGAVEESALQDILFEFYKLPQQLRTVLQDPLRRAILDAGYPEQARRLIVPQSPDIVASVSSAIERGEVIAPETTLDLETEIFQNKGTPREADLRNIKLRLLIDQGKVGEYLEAAISSDALNEADFLATLANSTPSELLKSAVERAERRSEFPEYIATGFANELVQLGFADVARLWADSPTQAQEEASKTRATPMPIDVNPDPSQLFSEAERLLGISGNVRSLADEILAR